MFNLHTNQRETNKQFETTAFTNVPHINELYCIICSFFPQNICKPISLYCNLLSRLVLCEIQEIIAAPNTENDTFYVIFKKHEFTQNDIISKIRNLFKNILFSEPKPVTPNIYKICLEYTIFFKLAPKWHMVNKYFVQSKDMFFHRNEFSDCSELDAILLNITLENEKFVCLHFNAIVCTVSYLDPKTLFHKTLDNFLNDPEGCINFDVLLTVYALPSLKKGKLVSIFKDNSQDTIRKNWLIWHNYILPKDILYCKVYHSSFEQDYSIYPHVCLMNKPLEFKNYNVTTYKQVIATMLKDLIIGVSSILHVRLEFMGSVDVSTQMFEPDKSEDQAGLISYNCKNSTEEAVICKYGSTLTLTLIDGTNYTPCEMTSISYINSPTFFDINNASSASQHIQNQDISTNIEMYLDSNTCQWTNCSSCKLIQDTQSSDLSSNTSHVQNDKVLKIPRSTEKTNILSRKIITKAKIEKSTKKRKRGRRQKSIQSNS